MWLQGAQSFQSTGAFVFHKPNIGCSASLIRLGLPDTDQQRASTIRSWLNVPPLKCRSLRTA